MIIELLFPHDCFCFEFVQCVFSVPCTCPSLLCDFQKVDHLEKCKQELYLFRITHILSSLLSERKTGPIK